MAIHQRRLITLALLSLLVVCCGQGGLGVAPTPAKTRVVPALPSVIPTPLASDTSTPAPTAAPTAAIPATRIPPSPTLLLPTDTPWPPSATYTLTPAPLGTATPPSTAEPSPSTAPTVAAERPTAAAPTAPSSGEALPPLPAQEGGEWDMEAGFVPGVSPLGEDCPGWSVAAGWEAFLAPGTPASSCLNENKNLANVYSGQRSQELTFDFINAEAGIYRHAQTIPGHRYQIEAWGKHVRSKSPVELSLGIDLTGGNDWGADSVTWVPWDETEEEAWVHTQLTVTADGEILTLFLKGYHPFAAQGGATLFDNARVLDLGP